MISQVPDTQFPYDIYWEDLLTKSQVQQVFDLVENFREKNNSRGKTGTTDSIERADIRRSNLVWIPHNDTTNWLYKLISDRVLELNRDFYNFELAGTQALQYTEYDASEQGHYDWHCDISFLEKNNQSCVRKISVSVVLSDTTEYKGGAFLFAPTGRAIEVEQKSGRMIVFPSWVPHCVKPILQGQRRSLVLWFYGKKFK
jgi:PKHD-type hydroxylase